jgi:hypothetical protein
VGESVIWLPDKAAQTDATFIGGNWMTNMCFVGKDLNNDGNIDGDDAALLAASIAVEVGSWNGTTFDAFILNRSSRGSYELPIPPRGMLLARNFRGIMSKCVRTS